MNDLAVQALGASWQVLIELSPSLLLGVFLAGILHVVLPANFAARQLRGRVGVLKAVVFGVPLPLCSCGVLPAGLGLKKDGASNGASIGFLISTPQTGVDSVAVSGAFLGWPFALFKVVSAAVTGLVGGWLADRVSSPDSELAAATECHVSEGNTARESRLQAMTSHALELLHSIWGWLIVGVLISVAIEVFVPAHVFASAAAWGGLGAAFAALVLSLPLYVCATASVPIAASLVAAGLPAGAALVFLMAGPATNAATVGAIYRAFGGRVLGVYLSTLIFGSIGFGLGFDFLIGGATASSAAHHEHGAAWWQLVLTVGLLVLLAFFAASDFSRWWRQRVATAKPSDSEISLSVEGLTCGGCVRKLEQTLSAAEGVDHAEVTLKPGRATVTGAIDEQRIRELVTEAGFQTI